MTSAHLASELNAQQEIVLLLLEEPLEERVFYMRGGKTLYQDEAN